MTLELPRTPPDNVQGFSTLLKSNMTHFSYLLFLTAMVDVFTVGGLKQNIKLMFCMATRERMQSLKGFGSCCLSMEHFLTHPARITPYGAEF